MKVPGITIPDVPEAGKIDGDEMLLVLENNELRMKTIDVAKGVFKFPDFAPRLIASLAASSTAACTSGGVTVTAAAHGIPATTFDGYQFYYPGSASLPAGWYSGFSRTGANDLTFSAPLAADFASESVNAGAAFTSEVTCESIVIQKNTLRVGGAATVSFFRSSNSAAGTKTHRLKINSNVVNSHANSSTTSIIGITEMGFYVDSPSTAIGSGTYVPGLGSTQSKVDADITSDLTISFTNQLSAAGLYIAMIIPSFRVE